MRSQIDDVANAALTFVCRQVFISVNFRNVPECMVRRPTALRFGFFHRFGFFRFVKTMS
jgi:hypothetical protein